MHHRDRIHRPRACNDPGHAHELTFSCFRRHQFLARERTCQWLASAIRDACVELNYALWAYVFMPEHAHLIVFPRDEVYDDSDFLKRVKEPVSRKAVQYLKSKAPEWLPKIRVRKGDGFEHHFWQPGRGYDRNVERTRTLLQMVDYVHLNPERRGLVQDAREWKWSSAGWFAGRPLNDLRPDTIPWDWLEGALF